MDVPTTLRDPERGNGLTSRQLADLPDGGIFIVAHAGMADHCRRLLQRAGRAHNAVKLIVISSPHDTDRLNGIRRGTPWAIDHAFYECASPAGRRQVIVVQAILSR